MKKKILVIGSIAIDTTIISKSMPVAGTTTTAESYFTNVGGKGANQACASLFLGGMFLLLEQLVKMRMEN